MAKSKDFRFQSSAVATPDANIASYYVNNSGILHFINPAGTAFVASTFYPTVLANSQITATGLVTFPNNLGAFSTGLAYGTSGTYTIGTVLGSPNVWLPVTGPSGQAYVIPLYLRS